MTTTTGSSIAVYLVDDSSLVRTLLAKSLAMAEGITVVGAADNGQQALEFLTMQKPPVAVDVLITDMDMPVMNGLELIQRVMATRPMPIILLSSWAHNDRQITQSSLEAGAADFVPKPSAMNPQGFQETLNALVMKIKTVASTHNAVASSTTARSTRANAATDIGTVPPVHFEKRINQTILGIGELNAVSTSTGGGLKTFALGSCVAVHLFTPSNDIIGMAHIALPASSIAPDKAVTLPGYFADTAIPALIGKMRDLGFAQAESTLGAKIVGGASTAADTNNHFKIGERNIQAVKQILSSKGITLSAEDVGGSQSRTVAVQPASPQVTISLGDRTTWTI
jgi:chemotaxis protein CheD